MDEVRRYALTVDAAGAGERLDRALARAFPDYSRTRIQGWIRAGRVRVNGGLVTTARRPLAAGEHIEFEAAFEAVIADEPEPIALDIVHEDADLVVINKPPGLVVHPGAGHREGTLMNGLLHHASGLDRLPRAGLVHRLDKDTSGLLVVAKTSAAHAALVAALARREVHREYLALVRGEVVAGERIEAAIGRHPGARTKMAVRMGGRPAVTHTRVAERLGGFTLLAATLESGRTHQIRVHLAHRGMPIVGDPVYGGRRGTPPGLPPAAREALAGFRRQALHARRLGFTHPVSGREVEFEAPLPADFAALIAALKSENSG